MELFLSSSDCVRTKQNCAVSLYSAVAVYNTKTNAGDTIYVILGPY